MPNPMTQRPAQMQMLNNNYQVSQQFHAQAQAPQHPSHVSNSKFVQQQNPPQPQQPRQGHVPNIQQQQQQHYLTQNLNQRYDPPQTHHHLQQPTRHLTQQQYHNNQQNALYQPTQMQSQFVAPSTAPPPSATQTQGEGMTQHQESTKDGPRVVTKSKPPSLRVFSSGVSRAKEWLHLKKASAAPPPVMFRVYGQLASLSAVPGAKDRTARKVLVLADLHDTSQTIRCVFQEIDRGIGSGTKVGDKVVVAGVSRGRSEEADLQIFCADTFAVEEVEPYLARMENFAIRSMKTLK